MERTTTAQSEKRLNQETLNFTVDSFADGIAFGQHRLPPGADPRAFYSLRLHRDAGVVRLRSRYKLHPENPLYELERHLMGLSQQGILGSASIYFGTSTDPFFPFEGKFDASMRFLELFQRYTPGMLHVQTRSPLIVIALPVFKKLGRHCAVTIALETCTDELASRYTPDLPRISERLKTVRALRRFGVEVHLQVAPVLPYGDWKGDADAFAELLVEHADYLWVEPLADGTELAERKLRNTAVVRRIAADRKFHWLRPDAAQPLLQAIERIAPEKLALPERPQLGKKQLEIFAA